MAKTRDYMDYLDNEIGIAPANSQEEFQAAETIVELMKDHDLEPTIQEFDARPAAKYAPPVLMVILFVGILLSGLGSTILRLVGLLLVAVPAVMLLVVHSGSPFLEHLGPTSKSQNVIAVHRATGDKVTKGNRPIVIVAHYDTPHESVLYGRLASYQSLLKRASVPCVIVVLVMAVMQILTFLPSGLRVVLWIVGLVAALPLLLLAVVTFTERFSPCTVGANDNKSSVAALLSVMDEVRPADDRASRGTDSSTGPDVSSDKEGEAQATNASPIYGVRHGKEVLEELGILPETCEIVYEDVQDEPPLDYDDADAQEDGYPEAGQYPGYDEEGYYADETYTDTSEDADDAGEGEVQPEDAYGRQDDWSDGEYDDSVLDGTKPDDGWGDDLEAQQGEATEGSPDDEWDYGEDGSYDSSAYEDGQMTDDDWQDTPSDSAYAAQAPKQGFGTKVRNAFHNLRERMSSRKSADDIDIPRGAAQGDGDFSEFEETDWGEDDWSDGQYQPQEELRAINREELIARRSSVRTTESYDEPPVNDYSDNNDYDDQGYEEEQPEDDYDYEPSYEGESDEDAGPAANDDQADESQTEDVADEAPVRSRTNHDISHDNGPDWAVIESEEEYEEDETPGFDPAVYDQDDGQLEDLYDLNAAELSDVEDELEDDQLAGLAPQRRNKDASVASTSDEHQEPDEVATEADDDSQADMDADPDVDPDQPDETQREDDDRWDQELSWDDVDQQDEDEGDDILPKDTSGLDTISDDYDVYEEDASKDELDEPEPIDDPTWGQTTYEPPRPKSNVARRATLYDVPSPSDEEADPFASEDDSDTERDAEADEQNRADNWKGGAAIRSDLLEDESEDQDAWPDDAEGDVPDEPDYDEEDESYVPDDASYDEPQNDIPDEGELQESILRMGDDLLISHDIWFVAVGASSLEHAGIKAFLANFRQDIRGAFLINLDSIGAGVLTILTSEGLHAGRRSDRRLTRLLGDVAEDLHMNFQRASYGWDDTDATPAMRSRVRAVTVMGMDENGLPALSHTKNDVPENVDPRQAAAIARVITEAIRRS